MSKNFTAFFALCILVFFNGRTQDLPEQIIVQTQERIDKGYHLGTVIGIIDRNGTRYYGFGQVSLSDDSVPDEYSIFEIGSITKTFSTLLLADLELNGELDLNRSIHEYLQDGITTEDPMYRKINLLQLASHTSGLPREASNVNANKDNRYQKYTVKKLRSFLNRHLFEAPDPSKASYSNLGYMLLEHTMETVTGLSYESLLEKKITEVLDMPDTKIKLSSGQRDRLTRGFRDGKHTTETQLGIFPAMGGIRSTARDMLKYLGAQMNLYDSPLFEAMKKTHQPISVLNKNEGSIGLGWHILERKESGKKIIYHKGGTNGFVSFAGFDPEAQIGVVVLCNGRRYFSDLGFYLLDNTYPLYQSE